MLLCVSSSHCSRAAFHFRIDIALFYPTNAIQQTSCAAKSDPSALSRAVPVHLNGITQAWLCVVYVPSVMCVCMAMLIGSSLAVTH